MTVLVTRPREEAATKDLLRFITCGSVDDGKSTLIGRLLHEFEAHLRGSIGGPGEKLGPPRHHRRGP